MKSALTYLRQILHILGNDRRKVPWMIMVFWGASLLELAGLGLITPYIGLVVSPESIQGGRLGQMINFFGLPDDQESLLVILGTALIGVFLLKAVASMGINYIILRFSQNQQIQLSSSLMQAYQAQPYTEYLQRNSSEYIHNLHVLVRTFANGVVLNGLRTLSELIVSVMILGLLAWENLAALVVLSSLLGILVLGYDRLFQERLGFYGKQVNQISTSLVLVFDVTWKSTKEWSVQLTSSPQITDCE